MRDGTLGNFVAIERNTRLAGIIPAEREIVAKTEPLAGIAYKFGFSAVPLSPIQLIKVRLPADKDVHIEIFDEGRYSIFVRTSCGDHVLHAGRIPGAAPT